MFKRVKVLSLFVAISLVIATILPTNVSATEYIESAVNWGQRYSQEIAKDGYDVYKVVVPATMNVNLRVVDFYVGEHLDLYNGGFDCVIYDDSYNKINSFRMSSNSVYTTMLPEGTYYYHLENHANAGTKNTAVNYTIELYYSIATPVVTLKSLTKNTIDVQAKKGSDSIHGYEVRYRLSGGKWTTKKIEETGSLSTKLTKLKKGKYYSVQVRKYVESENGQKYFSKWSTIRKVKVK